MTRLGAVAYLNARPLVYGLELRPDLFSLRFDPPSKCAALLHENAIDVGMIPSIEYLRGHDGYAMAAGMGIASDGPVASVAIFSKGPLAGARTIAADTSSRTSNALMRILCRERFGIDPGIVPMAPDATAMLERCDAALLIGDPALFLDHAGLGLTKVDLGAEWTAMTGRPFVWAIWAGRPGVLSREALDALRTARDAGLAHLGPLAHDYCGAGRAAQCEAYLRDNIRYVLGEREAAGLADYYALAAAYGLVDSASAPVFF